MRRNRFRKKIGLENIFMFRTPSKRGYNAARLIFVHCTTFFEAGCAATRTVVDPATARSKYGCASGSILAEHSKVFSFNCQLTVALCLQVAPSIDFLRCGVGPQGYK